MKKSISFATCLNRWYRRSARDLPWRRTWDPYKIWISEIMLQQTTVTAVIPIYKKWIKQFPTVQSVAKAPMQKILRCWQGLGYYQRARNIHQAAKIIVKDFSGHIPPDTDLLRKLPGFGPYTTGAVMSIAFDKRVPIIDANIRRVFMRILSMDGPAKTEADPQILKALDRWMPRRNLRTFNQALMELGALVCRSREPMCNQCPVKAYCRGYAQGRQELIPVIVKRTLSDVRVVIGIIQQGNKVFIQKRPAKGLLADLWEFPGGKVNPGESLTAALKREIMEELGIRIETIKAFTWVRHYYTRYCAHLNVFTCQALDYPKTDKMHKWCSIGSLNKYPFPSGSAQIIEKMK